MEDRAATQAEREAEAHRRNRARLRALAGKIRDEAHFHEILGRIDDPDKRARVRDEIAPLLRFPVTA